MSEGGAEAKTLAIRRRCVFLLNETIMRHAWSSAKASTWDVLRDAMTRASQRLSEVAKASGTRNNNNDDDDVITALKPLQAALVMPGKAQSSDDSSGGGSGPPLDHELFSQLVTCCLSALEFESSVTDRWSAISDLLLSFVKTFYRDAEAYVQQAWAARTTARLGEKRSRHSSPEPTASGRGCHITYSCRLLLDPLYADALEPKVPFSD